MVVFHFQNKGLICMVNKFWTYIEFLEKKYIFKEEVPVEDEPNDIY